MGSPHKCKKIGLGPNFRLGPNFFIFWLLSLFSFTKPLTRTYHLRCRSPEVGLAQPNRKPGAVLMFRTKIFRFFNFKILFFLTFLFFFYFLSNFHLFQVSQEGWGPLPIKLVGPMNYITTIYFIILINKQINTI